MQLRADEALVAAGLCESIALAQALIMEGKALYGNVVILKPSEKIKDAARLRIKGAENPYVSRGAFKLKKAFEVFDITAHGKTCIDVGASTGGFTDIMLREGAKKVYAVDVGYNLLDWKIRSDSRVVILEKTNARFLNAEMFGELPGFGATDVSFISLKAVLPAIFSILSENADFIALVKPQFEAARKDVGEKGVVRDKAVHIKVLENICNFINGMNIRIAGISYSPIRGPEGNIEFLLHLAKTSQPSLINQDRILAVVDEAHEKLC